MPEYEKYPYLGNRKLWNIHSFKIVDEPLLSALRAYNSNENKEEDYENPNGVSSKTSEGTHMPILDLDFPHTYVPSTSPGHGHLYLNVPISKFRWFVLMCALRYAKVIEFGFFVWSIRRGHNQLRLPYIEKDEKDGGSYTYGWVRKLKPYRNRR